MDSDRNPHELQLAAAKHIGQVIEVYKNGILRPITKAWKI